MIYKKSCETKQEAIQKEALRDQIFDIIEGLFINLAILLTFVFLKFIQIKLTFLFAYTPFIHIAWWMIYTNKTSESMNRHIELLVRIYCVC